MKLTLFILLLVVSPLWFSGCTAVTQPESPPLLAAIVTPLPSKPAVLPVTGTPFSAITPTPAQVSTCTLPEDQKKVMTAKLIQAAEAGETAVVQQLMKDGAEVNGRDALGRTPAMAATHGNQVDALRVLIQAGADINIRDDRLDNPFLYAGAEGLLDILKLTIEAGADTKLTNRFGGTALIPAAERGHVEIVRELLTRTDVDINYVNNLGWTALLEAIILGDGGPRHTETVRLLVEAGTDVNLADAQGVTPLAHAQARGYLEMIEILQKAGAQ